MIVYESSFGEGKEITIELENKDKWWLKQYLEKNPQEFDFDQIEIEFYFKEGFPYPVLNNEKVEHIEIFSKEKIEEILNSKSRARTFNWTFVEV